MEQYQYRIKDFDLPQFIMNLEAYDDSKDVDGKNEISFAYNSTWHILRGTVIIKFSQESADVLTAQMVAYVELSEQTAQRLENDGHIRLPKELLRQSITFGYGALRGVMYLKTLNTPLSRLILPPFDVRQVVKEDLTFKIEKD